MTAEPGSPGPPASRGRGALGDLGQRVASGVVLALLALAALWAGGWFFAAFWMVAAIAIIWEWQRLVGGPGLRARIVAGAVAAACAAGLASLGYPQIAVAAVLIGAVVAAAAAGRSHAVWAGAGILYAGFMVLAVCVLRNSLFHGAAAILWLFAVVWTTDVMAYFGGRLIGGPKLWPRVSPGKTWSGFVVGVVAGAGVGAAVALASTTPGEARVVPLVLLGLCAAALSQAGDLFESGIKRRFGAKDSSQIIPGHGGVMDRLDGFVFAAIFAVAVGAAHKGAVAAAHGLLVW